MRTPKQVILTKIETTYGVDATPTSADAVHTTSDITWGAYEGETQTRDRLKDTFGAEAEVNVGPSSSLQVSVPLSGSGTPGTPPAIGPLLRACGMSETVAAGASVTYAPITDDPESLTLYYFLDGQWQPLLGARGTCKINMDAGQFPTIDFTLTSLYKKPSTKMMPTAAVIHQADEIPVNKQNTVGSVHGYNACMSSMSLDVGNQAAYRNLINCERVRISGRETTGQVTIDAPDIADKDYFLALESHNTVTTGAVSATHGKTAGNIVELSGEQVQLSGLSPQDAEGIMQYQIEARYLGNTGDDEFKLVFK